MKGGEEARGRSIGETRELMELDREESVLLLEREGERLLL
jgi:hypothetical protein